MKYPKITLGQVEAVWNKLGGEDGVEKFLSGVKEVRCVNAVKKIEVPLGPGCYKEYVVLYCSLRDLGFTEKQVPLVKLEEKMTELGLKKGYSSLAAKICDEYEDSTPLDMLMTPALKKEEDYFWVGTISEKGCWGTSSTLRNSERGEENRCLANGRWAFVLSESEVKYR